jgi:uroporphyrinogen decarboxylase
VRADAAFQEFSLAYTRKVLDGLVRERDENGRKVAVPSIVFTKGGGLWLESIADSGCDGVGVDWTVNLAQARARIGERCAIQGNLDPMVLMAGPDQVRSEARKVLDSFGPPTPGQAQIFNLGHGISQFTPPDNVLALVETVHQHSRAIRRRGAGAS